MESTELEFSKPSKTKPENPTEPTAESPINSQHGSHKGQYFIKLSEKAGEFTPIGAGNHARRAHHMGEGASDRLNNSEIRNKDYNLRVDGAEKDVSSSSTETEAAKA